MSGTFKRLRCVNWNKAKHQQMMEITILSGDVRKVLHLLSRKSNKEFPADAPCLCLLKVEHKLVLARVILQTTAW